MRNGVTQKYTVSTTGNFNRLHSFQHPARITLSKSSNSDWTSPGYVGSQRDCNSRSTCRSWAASKSIGRNTRCFELSVLNYLCSPQSPGAHAVPQLQFHVSTRETDLTSSSPITFEHNGEKLWFGSASRSNFLSKRGKAKTLGATEPTSPPKAKATTLRTETSSITKAMNPLTVTLTLSGTTLPETETSLPSPLYPEAPKRPVDWSYTIHSVE